MGISKKNDVLATTALVMFAALPTAAFAQQAADPALEAPIEEEAEVVVTGTRIVRDGYTAPTPVTVATTENLIATTPSNLADGLNKLPQFSNSSSPEGNSQLNANSAEHGNLLNLRGVGTSRVLIMFDGVRVPPTTYKGSVDVNVLPQLLVERVDVVTAGASAAYGSDAVSGVVNYVLDSDFEGIEGVAQYGISSEGDLGNHRFGVAFGSSFANERGHFIASAEQFHQDGIIRSEREFGESRSVAAGSVVGSPATPGTAANPLVFYTGASSTQQTFGGRITSSTVPGLVNRVFEPNGTIRPFVNGAPTGTSTVKIGGDGFYTPGYGTLIAPLETEQYFARGSFDFTNNLSGYLQSSYASSVTEYASQARFILGARIFSGNDFLHPSVQAQMGPADSFVIQEILPQYGPMETREVTDYVSFGGGLNGAFGDGWNWRTDFTYGESDTVVKQEQFDYLRLAAALDAVDDGSGNTVCRVTITNPGLYPGCVAYNPFGVGAASQTALDYTTGISRFQVENTMTALSASVSGDVFELPAGPVSVAVGGEYREQELSLTSNSNPAIPLNTTGLRAPITANRFSSTNVGIANGEVQVEEAFVEVAVPILSDAPFARSLEFNGAARYTNYSTSGGAETWKAGLTWEPVDGLSFRATRSRDIRAPGLYELFAGVTTVNSSFTDPHTGAAPFIQVRTGGNPDLDPEVGDTFTAGFVARPSWLPGFAISADWYSLKIEGAIAQQTVLDILNECEASNGLSPTCDLITRPLPFSDRTPANAPTAIRVINQNLSFIETSGIDLDASYRTDLGEGDLTLRLYVNWVNEFLQQTNSIARTYDYAGYVALGSVSYALPNLRGTLTAQYSLGETDLILQQSMIGEMQLGPTQVYAVDPIDPYFYTDVTIRQGLPGLEGWNAFFTVNNLFDKQPPFIAAAGSSAGTYYPTVGQLYDISGRTFTAGLRFSF